MYLRFEVAIVSIHLCKPPSFSKKVLGLQKVNMHLCDVPRKVGIELRLEFVRHFLFPKIPISFQYFHHFKY